MDDGKQELVVSSREVPVINADGEPVESLAAPAPDAPPAPLTRVERAAAFVAEGLAFAVALVWLVSLLEVVIVVFSRRWDDWLSFHVSRLAGIKPEEETPKARQIALDLDWLFRKLKRRIRGWFVLVAGLPVLLPLHLVPVVGSWLFSAMAFAWSCYWLGVFAAGKTAHAWVDAEAARPPLPLRALQDRAARIRIAGPIRWYGRVWAWVTYPVNPAVTTFERAPPAFLGLALARVVLALPGLYFLARPIVPVAAGRLCADADPGGRFTALARDGSRSG